MNNKTINFDYCISNPPYQESVAKTGTERNVSKEIYQDFQYSGTIISIKTSMIYPRNWTKKLQKDTSIGRKIVNCGVKSVYQLESGENLFPTIRKNYPLSIVNTEKDYNGLVNVDDDYTWNPDNTFWLSSLTQKKLWDKTKNYEKFFNGVRTEVNWSNQKDVVEEFSENIFHKDSTNLIDPVSIYLKKNPGKQPDGETVFVEKHFIKDSFPDSNVEKYNVAVRSSIVGRLGNFVEHMNYETKGLKARVFKPQETFGLTWFNLKDFDTLMEAQNCCNYVNSIFIMDLFYLDFSKIGFGRFVPDFIDYSNDNPVFTPNDDLPDNHEYKNLDLDDRLCKFFGF